MIVNEFGDPSADIVLIQMVYSNDLEYIEREISYISENSSSGFRFLAAEVPDWNHDLSPWYAPAVFGNEDFGDGAEATLNEVKKLCLERERSYYIGGYSLAGLFALWAGYQSDLFSGVAAASPSIWFPGFLDYMGGHKILTGRIYLSLGDKEAKTGNPVMATLADRISEAYEHLKEQALDCILEWNPGNHFRNADIRTAKAFVWLLSRHDP